MNVCSKNNNNRTRNSQLIEDFQETLINVDEHMSDNKSIYSIVSVEVVKKTQSDGSDSDNEALRNEMGLELKDLDLEELQISTMMNILQECEHEFERNKGIDSSQCILCRWYSSREKRAKCKFCYAEGCITCIENLLKLKR